jgi:murein DD-endopeptidase MepM/ murein hydrolase activator NlpD
MTNPVPNYKITTPYKREGKLWKLGYHTGVDYRAPQGTVVVAAQDGRVLEVSQRVSWGESYGTAIVVLHRDMTRAIYAHLSKTLVGRGDSLKAGDKIGKVGSTGNSTGAHLHFEVRTGNNKDGTGYKYGDDVDPAPYISNSEVSLGIERIGKVDNAKPKPAKTTTSNNTRRTNRSGSK